MHIPQFPDMDGVEFRHIPNWDGYAASSDGDIWTCHGGSWMTTRHIWTCHGGPWWMMPTQRLQTGPDSVWLRDPRGGQRAFNVAELLSLTFGTAALV